MDNNKPKVLVSDDESIARYVRNWLNTYDGKPQSLDTYYEYLNKTKGLAVSTIQAAYKVKQYITGGYMAQYQFEILYRLIASNDEERLAADEMLNAFGEWAETNIPELPDGVTRWKVRRDTNASLLVRYDNNAEDHTIQMTLTYEVI